ncbi:helix-turn-helix transcriptional regulator [Nonomuraea sp. H19]|uniref:helix-turn-helix transcriptional regulator n=1 Tax=Nonomuraea sp. H19 TaxID=3452206 RepID=UPI003F887C1F
MTQRRVRFIQRRKAAGYTQEELADALGIERSTAGRWERAETEPQPWLRPKLAKLLKVTSAELDELLAAVVTLPDKPGKFVLHSTVPLDFSLTRNNTVKIMEDFSVQDIASRREMLAGLSVLGGAAVLQPIRQWAASLPVVPVPAGGSAAEEVAELEQAVTVFRQWDASGVGGLRRKAVVGQLNAITESLGERHPVDVTRRLFGITAELAQLAGWIAYDQGLPGTAQRYYPAHPEWRRYAATAEKHTLSARESRGQAYTRSRIFDELRLAKVRLAQCEPVESAAVALHSLRLADQARSSLVVEWLIRFDRDLGSRYPGATGAATFHEELRAYLRRAAPGREGELRGRH